MTNREFLNSITEGAIVTGEMAEKAAEMRAKMDANLAARKGKVSAKEQEKRDANAAMAARIVAEHMTAQAKTAGDIQAELAEAGEELTVQKVSTLCVLAVKMGLATQTDVKVPKKGNLKAYSIVE